MNINYTIVVCTYNPDARILGRCLRAIAALDLSALTIEVLIVDNNSTLPVAEMAEVKDCAPRLQNLKLIVVTEQGVAHARIEAIKQARGTEIVYFDYDNEPRADYLQQLARLNKEFPLVACWGPGNVNVDLIDGIAPELEAYARVAFQEKREKQRTFANIREWQAFYPFGTGLCTHAAVLKDYVNEVESGTYTMPGRKGAKLTGGEDTQMVLHAIKQGYAAGSSPSLTLNHIIPANRANIKYLKRFALHTGLDYMSCYLQVFPDDMEKVKGMQVSPAKFVRRVVKELFKAKLSGSKVKLLNVIIRIGHLAGVYRALNQPLPKSIVKIEKWLGLS